MQFTGWGWTAFAIPFFAPFLGAAAGAGLGAEGLTPILLCAVGGEYAAAGLLFLLGLAVNSTRTPQGRHWRNDHTLAEMSLQFIGVTVALVIGSIILSIRVGQVTAAWLGWAALVATVAVSGAIGAVVYRKTD
ncbi:hypothetical protein [Actinomadura chibensis]|uniref:Uncharacterized protein n=1 Tax=Actinomadura chibensis TaxID=392828 RepID=A0A5D0NLB6_9ACTN|nr:hypothetical protein [Actinomadura chibensis]TYB45267.1 hypothetical protein FXF69_17575 [Actinomadura chibensis]